MTREKPSPAAASTPAYEGLAPDAAHPWRHQNLGRLLLFSFHAFEARLVERYQAAGFADVRQVHLNALRHIDDPGGTRIVDLAARAGITKGAMGQLIVECQRLDLVKLAPHRSDKRAKLVCFSTRGRRFMRATEKAVRDIEKDFTRMLGVTRFASLCQTLAVLRQAITDEE